MNFTHLSLFGYSALALGLFACASFADAGGETTGTGGAGGTMTVKGTEPPPPPEPKGGLTQSEPFKDPVFTASCPDSWEVQNMLTMSSDDSNSMGSPGYAREMLRAKKAPDPALIRTYEFLNYYHPGYAAAKPDTLAVYAGLMDGVMPGAYRVQVAVQAPPPASPRRPASLTLIVDTSQSMAGQGIAIAKEAVKAIAGSLAVNDRVSLLTLDAEAEPLLDGELIADPMDINGVIAKTDDLFIGKGSDIQGALVRGYALALQHVMSGAMNRVVFITDGRASPQTFDPTFVGEHAKEGADSGIYLVGVGTGPADGYNDGLLNGLTDYGRGAYVYIDTVTEAQTMFSARFQEVMEIAARDVVVKLTMPNYMHLQHYYGEAVDPVGVEPAAQHLSSGGAMVFNLTVDTCAVDALSLADNLIVDVAWKTVLDDAPRQTSAIFEIGTIKKDPSSAMIKSNAVISYAEALKSLDLKRLEGALADVDAAASLTSDADLADIAALLRCHPAFSNKYPCP